MEANYDRPYFYPRGEFLQIPLLLHHRPGAPGLRTAVRRRNRKERGVRPKGDVRLWIAAGKPAAKVHLALCSPSREAVGVFHSAALRAGGKDNGKPGLRPDYHPTYYAAFVFDPDGNNLEAVTHEAE